MELRQLRHFLEVYRRASFGQAAVALGLTQPALSKSIRNLELELQVSLLDRGPSGVAPTQYGRLLAEYAALVDNELRRAESEIAAVRGAGKGTVRVGGSPSTLRYLMPMVMARFAAKHPAVSVRLTEGVKAELVSALRRGDIDLAITSLLEGDSFSDLVWDVLLDDRIVVVADRDHPLAGRTALGFADLQPFPWIIPNSSETERQRLNAAMQAAGLPAPRVAVETNSSALMVTLLPGSQNLSYLPIRLLDRDPYAARLRALDVPAIWATARTIAVRRRQGVLLPATQVFLHAVKRTAAELAAGGAISSAQTGSAKPPARRRPAADAGSPPR